jgi:dTMP kinase
MASLQKNGKFITVEGGECVGKSTFIKALSTKLEEQSIDHITTREPGGTIVGEELRKIFDNLDSKETLSIESELFIVSAGRSQHIDHKIQPALAKNKWVICDRYCDSTLVYQGVIGGMRLELIDKINQISTRNIQPDLTFYLDCNIQTIMDRIHKRYRRKCTQQHRFEQDNENFHMKLQSAYQKIAARDPDRFIKINTDKSINHSISEALKIIKLRLL